MNINGIIVQEETNSLYRGVEGNNWYLNCFQTFEKYYNEVIDKSWCNNNFVDVCSDVKYIQKYISISMQKQIDFRLILCCTESEFPCFDFDVNHASFLGYDYAYSGGSYYSAIYNDIVSRRICEFRKINLNKFCLFNNIAEVKYFLQKRNKLNNKYYIEKGNYLIYKLYEIMPDYFMG